MFSELQTTKNYINERIIRTLISTILLHMQKREKHDKSLIYTGHTLSKNIVIQFLKLLNEYHRQELSVQFYIDRLATTESILKNTCKKILGFSPKEIIQQKLISEAKNMLLNKTLTIKEIAYGLGYSDTSNFNKFFLKRTGKTPRQFRLHSNTKDIII